MSKEDRINKARAEQLIARATFLLRQGELEKSLAGYELAYDLYPTPAALDGMGCALLLQGELNLAEQYFLLAGEYGEYDKWLGNLALLMEIRGDKEYAGDLYSSYLKENALDPKINTNYSALLLDRLLMRGPSSGAISPHKLDMSEVLSRLQKATVLGGGKIAEKNLRIAEDKREVKRGDEDEKD